MATANEELKSVVRNWIANRIHSTNDDYLASNDYVKFHRIEEEGATSGVYSTILKDTDASGQIEFVDTLDDSDYVTVQNNSVYGRYLVMVDANGEVVPDVTPSYIDVPVWTPEFEQSFATRIENLVSHQYDAEIDRAASEDPSQAEAYLKLKTVVGYEVRRGKYIVFVDANNEVVPFPDDFYDPFIFRDYYMWSAEGVQNVEAILEEIKSGALDSQFENLARNNPSDAEKIMKYKDIVGYDIREPTEDTTETSPDKNMKVVGLNMFNDAVATLENSITSSNGDINALTTRIAELEKRLEALISAFEPDPTATEVLTALHERLKSKTPMTIREVLELDRISNSGISEFRLIPKLLDEIGELGYYIYTWEKTFDDTDAETTSIINLYNALKESASISESFQTPYGNQLYKALLNVENKTTDMTTYIQKWEDANSDVNAKREAFYQKMAEYTTAIENNAAFTIRDYVLFTLFCTAYFNAIGDPNYPNEILVFRDTINANSSNISLDMNDDETKMMVDLFHEIKGQNESFHFLACKNIYATLYNQYYKNKNDDVEIPENVKKYYDTYTDMLNEWFLTFTV